MPIAAGRSSRLPPCRWSLSRASAGSAGWAECAPRANGDSSGWAFPLSAHGDPVRRDRQYFAPGQGSDAGPYPGIGYQGGVVPTMQSLTAAHAAELVRFERKNRAWLRRLVATASRSNAASRAVLLAAGFVPVSEDGTDVLHHRELNWTVDPRAARRMNDVDGPTLAAYAIRAGLSTNIN